MFPEKLIELISEKVSKRFLFIVLIIAGIINFDISSNIFFLVLESAWDAILLLVLICGGAALLIKKSRKKGYESYRRREYTNHQTDICNNDIQLVVNINKRKCLYGLEPERQIILFNRMEQTIKSIKGYIDFIKISERKIDDQNFGLCVERIPFEVSHLQPYIGTIIRMDVGFNISKEWNYISVWVEKLKTEKDIKTDIELKSKTIYRIPAYDDLLASNRDMRWIKEKFRGFLSFIRHHWRRQMYSLGGKKYCVGELKELFRIFMSRFAITILAIPLLLLVLGIGGVIAKGIVKIFIIHVDYIAQIW